MSGSVPAQQYSLRCNNYQNNLTSALCQQLQSEAFVDVTLACDGNSLKAHKVVLSACSPYFQALFSDNPCSHPIVILKDVKWAELKAIVEFVYRGEINVSQQELAPLLKVAESLQVCGFADVNRGASHTAQFASHLKNGSEAKDQAPGPSGLHLSQEVHPSLVPRSSQPLRTKTQQNSATQTTQQNSATQTTPQSCATQTTQKNSATQTTQHLLTNTNHGSNLQNLPSGSQRRKYHFDNERSNSKEHRKPMEIYSTNGDWPAHSPLGIQEPLTITPGIAHGPVKSSSSSFVGSGSATMLATSNPTLSKINSQQNGSKAWGGILASA